MKIISEALEETDDEGALPSEAELRDIFKAIDKDGSGNVNAAELKEALVNLGQNISDKDIDEMIKVAGQFFLDVKRGSLLGF